MFSGDSRLVLNSMRTVVVSIYHTVGTFCVIRMRTEPILYGDRIGPYSSPSLDHDNVVEAALGGAENRRRQATSDQRGGPHCLLSKTGTRQEQAKDSKQASKQASEQVKVRTNHHAPWETFRSEASTGISFGRKRLWLAQQQTTASCMLGHDTVPTGIDTGSIISEREKPSSRRKPPCYCW